MAGWENNRVDSSNIADRIWVDLQPGKYKSDYIQLSQHTKYLVWIAEAKTTKLTATPSTSKSDGNGTKLVSKADILEFVEQKI